MTVNPRDILIGLDDGHGDNGVTPGKRTPKFKDGTFMYENAFNKVVVKYLDVHLRRNGFRTLLVAPTDKDHPLSERVKKANDAKVKLYVSVHANANTGKWGEWGGAETFTYGSGEGLRIGKIIHKHLMKGTPLRDRGMKKGSHLYVIKNTTMPSVLVECAFMDNLLEAKLLLSDAFRRECAREIAMGICESYGVKYVAEQESKPQASPSTWYRVRLNWADAKTQKGAFQDIAHAKELADSLKTQGDYRVFDEKGIMLYDPTPEKQDDIWYRVRKTWADSKSQIGAFHEVEGARELADAHAKDGFEVYDEKGKVVYQPKVDVTPISSPKPTPKPEPKPTPKPEPKPEPVDLHKGHTSIMGKSVLKPEKMATFVKTINPNALNIEEIAKCFIEVGEEYGVRGDIAFCQATIETGWFKFDGGTAVTPDQHNYCGMGVTSKGMKGNSFTTVHEGVIAQIQHLFAYACKNELPNGAVLLDPRYKLVTRGVAPHWEDLSNRWAMNENYGKHILSLYSKLTDYEYVPPVIETPQPEPIEPEPVEPPVIEEPQPIELPKEEVPNSEEEKMNFFKKLIDYFFEKLFNMKGGNK